MTGGAVGGVGDTGPVDRETNEQAMSATHPDSAPLPTGRLAAIKARCDAALPGPWKQEPNTAAGRVWVRMAHHSDCQPNTDRRNGWQRLFEVRSFRDNYWPKTQEAVYRQREADAAFIAHAREDVPWLLERVDALVGALADAHAALGQHLVDRP